MRILIVSPSIEDTNGRGLNYIAENIIEGLALHKHEVGLLVGTPKRKHFTKDPVYDAQIDQIYLQHYLDEGRKSFKYLVKGGYRKVNLAKAILNGSIYKPREISIDTEKLSKKKTLLKKLNFCIESPYVYQFISRNHSKRVKKILNNIAKQNNIDLIICTSPVAISSKDLPKKTNLVQFVHDFMPIEMTETPPDHDTPLVFAEQAYSAVFGSDLVLTNSKDTERKILERNPKANSYVLYGNVAFPEESKIHSTILKQKNLKKDHYLVFASAIEKRKNLENIFDAYVLSFEKIHRMPLVIIGAPGYGIENILKKYDSLPDDVKDSVLFTGFISNDDKAALFYGAKACVFPSLYEGLGIPVVEAIVANIPVLTTRIGALPEAGLNAAHYIENPYNIGEIADGIDMIVNSSELRENLTKNRGEVVKFFSSESYKQRLVIAIEKIEELKA